ncbi:MAG TPA: hypothetical protein VE244_02540 [Nitrososphaeraceae archaeon]|jgi:hypothetical protein|nr:hypothetical protein [Nitrososphaeraceae archaeon]
MVRRRRKQKEKKKKTEGEEEGEEMSIHPQSQELAVIVNYTNCYYYY